MKLRIIKDRLRAFALMESLVSVVLFAILASIFSSTYMSIDGATVHTNNGLDADGILSESVEAVRSIRDQNYLYLENGAHGLQNSGGVWSVAGTEDTIDDFFVRKITISDVFRNIDGDLDPNGTMADDRTKYVDIEVSWQSDVEGAQQISTEYTIADIYAYDQISTTNNDWDSGTYFQTTNSNIDDGALVLDKEEDWNNSLNQVNYEFSNNADASAIDVSGNRGYMVGDFSGVGKDNLAVLDSTDT